MNFNPWTIRERSASHDPLPRVLWLVCTLSACLQTPTTAREASFDETAASDGGASTGESDAACDSECLLGRPADSKGDFACSADQDCRAPGLRTCGPQGSCVECTQDQAGACRPTEPYCSATYECVACLRNDQCPPQAPRCDGRACSACMEPTDCASRAATPVCDSESGACVECAVGNDAKCTSEGRVCLDGGTRCVACNTHDDCLDPSKARCDPVTHACVPCDDSSQCEHVAVSGTDDFDVCSAGACVQCTPDTEQSECGLKACDPASLACTQKNRNSVAACGTCRSDSECVTGHKCVQVPFEGADSGYHCMRQVPVEGCVPPFKSAPLIAESKNGFPAASYCSHNTNVTSCRAVLALTSNTSCALATEADDCGPGGRCGSVTTTPNKCTYPCSSDLTCPADAECNEESSADPYCGG